MYRGLHKENKSLCTIKHPEDGIDKFLRNDNNHLQDYGVTTQNITMPAITSFYFRSVWNRRQLLSQHEWRLIIKLTEGLSEGCRNHKRLDMYLPAQCRNPLKLALSTNALRGTGINLWLQSELWCGTLWFLPPSIVCSSAHTESLRKLQGQPKTYFFWLQTRINIGHSISSCRGQQLFYGLLEVMTPYVFREKLSLPF